MSLTFRKRFAGSFARRAPLAALCLAAVGVAQPPPDVTAPFAERVEVEVVNVDVVVTDRDGRRVTDLGRADFELFVDGEPVAIEYFAAPPAAARPHAPAPATVPSLAPETVAPLPPPAAAPEGPALLVLYVDQSALGHFVRGHTLTELREFARTRDANELLMLAAFEDDLRLLAAPTAETAEVEAAFTTLEKLPARASLTVAERRRLEHEVRDYGKPQPMVRSTIEPELSQSQNEDQVSRRQSDEFERLSTEITLWAEQELDRQRRSVEAMRHVVNALAALPGRKTAVLATAGFDAEPGRYLLRFLAQKREYTAGASAIPKLARLMDQGVRLSTEFEDLVRAAQNARVAFYTVSAPDAPPSANDAEFESAGADQELPAPRDLAPVERSSSVARLAGATGGRTFMLDSTLDARLGEVRDDARAVYSLGFTTGPEAGSKDHSIDVRVTGARRAGLDVRHRESYRRRSIEERQEEALMAAATLGETANGAGLRLDLGTPAPPEKGGAARLVPIAVRIPIGSLALVGVGPLHQGRIRVKIAVHAGDGRVSTDAGTPIDIAIPEGDYERALGEVWVHRAEVQLRPGHHRIAVLVADEGAGTFSTVSMPVEIGEL
jgi:VWFA-related protein